MTYKYNLSALVEQKYPSGRVVRNVLENDGQLSIVQSKKNQSAGYWNYADSLTYNAAGAMESMQLGNGKWESTKFNSRLQPTQIALGTVQSGTDKLKLDYEYNTLGQTDNNGNVLKQTISVVSVGSTPGFTAVQTYTYDSLNRIKSANESLTPQGQSAYASSKQTFTFDRYGNRRFDEANTDTLAPGCATAVCNPTIDPATNKLIGYVFDSSGNTKTDAQNRTFIYDGENKQIEVKDSSNYTIGKYFYDGDGKRVKKIEYSSNTPVQTTIFIYDASGKMVAEYETEVAPVSTAQVSYLTQDHLGSPRITTDKDGKVFSRRDFMPFGEEITSNHTPERSINLNYGEDGIRQKFTSYERDIETELDYAKARMFGSGFGRFTSPDPLLSSGRSILPASWNRYVYTLNNPLRFIDPLGLYEFDPTQNWTNDEKDAFRKNLKAGKKHLKKIKKTYGKNSDEYLEAKKSLESYGCEAGKGKCNDRNVVVSKDASLKGEARTVLIDNDTRVQVKFDPTRFSSNGESTGFASQIAHEGVHVVDSFNYINSNKKIKVTDFDTERRGYIVESAMGHVMQIDVQGKENKFAPISVGGQTYSLFDPSWRTANTNVSQIESIRIERNKSIDSVLAIPSPAGYGLTPQNPGNSYFP